MTTSEFAEVTGISKYTLRRWYKKGILKCIKTPTNQLRFTKEMAEKLLETTKNNEEEL
jgi:excisionase family DNA binding protein